MSGIGPLKPRLFGQPNGWRCPDDTEFLWGDHGMELPTDPSIPIGHGALPSPIPGRSSAYALETYRRSCGTSFDPFLSRTNAYAYRLVVKKAERFTKLVQLTGRSAKWHPNSLLGALSGENASSEFRLTARFEIL